MLVEFRMLRLPLFWRHSQCLIDGARHAHQVPGVDVNRVGQGSSGSRELGENQGALGFLLADYVLQARSVHTVSDGCNQANIGHPQ